MKLLSILLMLLISTVTKAQLTNESEAGLTSANGNTKAQSYTIKQINDYKWDMNVLSFKFRYLNAKANGEETARYLMGGLRYERQLRHQFGLFIGEIFESDKFVNIEKRLINDAGGKYRFIETEMTKLFSEIGYRYMHENRFDGSNVYSNYGRLYGEWEQKWNTNFSTKYWAEYLPNISENKDWQLNTELSISVVMNRIFSLKSGILVRHDQVPAPGILFKTDTLFTTAFVAKF
jgi:putative salt-induced outer membrane protein